MASDTSDVENLATDDEPSAIDISHVDRRIWLVKLPEFLMERWTDIKESDLDLGYVRIYDPVPGRPPKVTFHLGKDPRMTDLPKEYDLNFLKHTKPNYVFSEEGGVAIAIEGRIEHECHLKPTIAEEYRQVMKQRTVDSNKPKRSVQLIDSVTENGVKLGLLRPVSEAQLLKNIKRRAVAVEQRRERLPREELRELLFSAFERYTHWSLKGLIEYTKQPTVFLKELLNDIALYNKRGPYKSTYQLKPEYKSASGRTHSPISTLAPGTSIGDGEDEEEEMEEITGAEENSPDHEEDEFIEEQF